MAAGVKLSKMTPFEMNPRGNLWYNDENTFGRKILSQMGWSKGKGLGKHEDGIKENIKIGKKDNLTGVGWKSDVHISVGCAEYENILSKLQQRFKNKKTEGKKPDKSKKLDSLEKRSQTSRSRLHYQKFVRAKDFFTRSEKDMKCIFLDNPKDAEEGNAENGVLTHKSDLSVTDYFAMKMKQKLGKMIPDSKEPNIKLEREAVEKQETSNKQETNECKKFEELRTSAEVKFTIKSEEEFSNKGSSSKKRKNAMDHFNGSTNATDVESKIKCEKEFDYSQSSSKKQESLDEDINSSKNKLKTKSEKEVVSKKKHKNSSDASMEEVKTKSKKDKKLSKKRKNSTEGMAQIKKIKLESEDGWSSVVEINCVEETPNVVVRPKSKKKRSHKLRGLKSCIRKNVSYDLKRDRKVFFNEQVSYKILDTSFESLTPINDLVVDKQNLVEEGVDEESSSEDDEQNTEFINAEGFMTNIRQFNEKSESRIKHDKKAELDSCNGGFSTNLKESFDVPVTDSSEQECKKRIKNDFNSSKLSQKDAEDSFPECFKLPKRVSSDLSMWSESQRAATKMKIYKDMIKGIRKDQVLRTTNLLDIKGYGNWEM